MEMKAEEAKRTAILSSQLQIDEVTLAINKATELGEMSINYNGLRPATKVWLAENGYKVEHFDSSNYSTDHISW